jgi:LPS-assembly protein
MTRVRISRFALFALFTAFFAFLPPLGELEAEGASRRASKAKSVSKTQSTSMPQVVTLDAERVSYDDEAGKARAEGGAVMTHGSTVVRANRIDYDAVTQDVVALPLPGEVVEMRAEGRTLTSDRLEYNLLTGESRAAGTKSGFPVGGGTLYARGGELQVVPYETARAQGLIRDIRKNPPAFIGLARDAVITTCALDHPHYRLETKHMTIIPGRRVVARKPSLYLGDAYIFTYPLDFIVLIDRQATRHPITPYIQYGETRGLTVGLSGAYAWDTGAFDLGLAYVSTAGFEWMAAFHQNITNNLAVTAGLEYSWDEAWDEKMYRPRASLLYGFSGWQAAMNWTWGEYIAVRKDAYYIYKGRLERKPEVVLSSPWFKDPALPRSWYQLAARWGKYQERTPTFSNDAISRYGVAFYHYAEAPIIQGAELFLNTRYEAWLYDRDGLDQEYINSLLGLRWQLGPFQFGTGYERGFAWGASPMLWDAYGDLERFHQQARISLSKELFVTVRGSYDVTAELLYEVDYSLQWLTDCMIWEIVYHNDRSAAEENKIALRMSLRAFPNTPFSFGEYSSWNPFARPGVPK